MGAIGNYRPKRDRATPNNVRELMRALRFGMPKRKDVDWNSAGDKPNLDAAELRHAAKQLGFYLAVRKEFQAAERYVLLDDLNREKNPSFGEGVSLPRVDSWALVKPVNGKPDIQLCPIATVDLLLQAIARGEPAVYELGEVNYLRALASAENANG